MPVTRSGAHMDDDRKCIIEEVLNLVCSENQPMTPDPYRNVDARFRVAMPGIAGQHVLAQNPHPPDGKAAGQFAASDVQFLCRRAAQGGRSVEPLTLLVSAD